MQNSSKGLIAVLIIAVLALATWQFLNMPDQRTSGQKVGDAIDAIPEGAGKAVQQLEDRTPGEKLGDAMKDATDH